MFLFIVSGKVNWALNTYFHFYFTVTFSFLWNILPFQLVDTIFCLYFSLPFTIVLSYFCSFDFFLFFLRTPDRSIDRSMSSIECRVTCVDSFWWDCSKRKGRGVQLCVRWCFMYGWYLREGEKMKVAVCYIMASVINRWRNQQLEILGPSPALSDDFQN